MKNNNDINWDNKQLVYQRELRVIIKTTGTHKGIFFSGKVVELGKSEVKEGDVLDNLFKPHYKPTPNDATNIK